MDILAWEQTKVVKKEEMADDGWADDSDEEVPELAD